MTVAAYRDRTTGRYPITLDDLRRSAGMLFGDEPTPDVLDFVGVDPVTATEPPVHDPAMKTLAEGAPGSDGSGWFQTWTLTDVPQPPPMPVIVSPADLWRRATEAEAEAIEAAMSSQPLRIRRLFERASTYQSDDPLWPLLYGSAVELFGAERAAELLAAS